MGGQKKSLEVTPHGGWKTIIWNDPPSTTKKVWSEPHQWQKENQKSYSIKGEKKFIDKLTPPIVGKTISLEGAYYEILYFTWLDPTG